MFTLAATDALVTRAVAESLVSRNAGRTTHIVILVGQSIVAQRRIGQPDNGRLGYELVSENG